MTASELSPMAQPALETPAQAFSEVALEDRSTVEAHPGPNKSTKPTTIEDLPNELVSNVFKYFDAPQPSSTKLNDEPVFEVTKSEDATLKAISLVSKRWRKAILPRLFQHARLTLTEFWLGDSIGSIETPKFLQFLGENSISEKVKTLAVCVPGIYPPNRTPGKYPLGVDSFWQTIFDEVNPVELLIVAPAEALGCLSTCFVETMDRSSFDAPFQYLWLQQPAPSSKFSSKGKGKESLQSDQSPAHGLVESIESLPDHSVPAGDQEEDLADPPESVPGDYEEENVADPPESIPDETFWSGRTEEEWMEPHVPADHSALFDVRPWSSLLINEGSFIKAYGTYNDGASKRPPSVSLLPTRHALAVLT